MFMLATLHTSKTLYIYTFFNCLKPMSLKSKSLRQAEVNSAKHLLKFILHLLLVLGKQACSIITVALHL